MAASAVLLDLAGAAATVEFDLGSSFDTTGKSIEYRVGDARVKEFPTVVSAQIEQRYTVSQVDSL